MSETILIVDDDPDVRETLRESLEYEGYSTAEATNGREALEYLRTHAAPCLVLLDLMMPVLDGQQFLEERGRDPALRSVRVFIVSAAAREEIDLAARSSGAVGVLTKPLQLNALLSAVQKHC